MDGVSSAVTVLEVLKLAWEVIGYIKAVKGADEERRKLSLELTRATGLLATVTDIAEEVKDDWARAIRALEGPAGALVAFYALLGEVRGEMGVKTDPKLVVQPSEQPASISLLGSSRLATWLQTRSSSRTASFAAPPCSLWRFTALTGTDPRIAACSPYWPSSSKTCWQPTSDFKSATTS